MGRAKKQSDLYQRAPPNALGIASTKYNKGTKNGKNG